MCEFCSNIYNYETDKLPNNDFIGYEPCSNTFHISAYTGDSGCWGCIDNVKYCPMCGKRLYYPECKTCVRFTEKTIRKE